LRDAVDVAGRWSVIVDWLQRHCAEEAAQVRPGASEAVLAAAQREVGAWFPADLLEWWRAADGMEGDCSLLPPMFTPYSVTQALESRRRWLGMSARSAMAEIARPEISAGEPAGTPCRYVWLAAWMPIAADGCGGDLFVDMRGGPASGCVVYFDHEEWAFERTEWPSVGAMIDETAEALSTGRPVDGHFPVAVEGRLEWVPAEEL
jgi:cell wall assembly regulator SMI1